MIKLYCPNTKEIVTIDENQVGFTANIYLQEEDGMLCSFKAPGTVVEAIVPDVNYDPRRLYEDILKKSETDWFEVSAIYVGDENPHMESDEEDEDLDADESASGDSNEW